MSAADFTVFVVDPDDAVRDALSVTLEAAGYRVALFRSAAEFLATYRPGVMGCLVVDLELPGTGGAALVRALGAQQIDVPTILTNGRLRSARVSRLVPDGVVAVLEKPFGDRELLEQVEIARTGWLAR